MVGAAEPGSDYVSIPLTFMLVRESTENEALPLTSYNTNSQPSNLMPVLPIQILHYEYNFPLLPQEIIWMLRIIRLYKVID